jgi:FKBP-type peptidyl-prolyl cis-trans isomerase (trigger factor)
MKSLEILNIGDDSGRKTLSIAAQWEQVAADYDDIVNEYSKVRIAGFRSGKAPRYIVEKQFQREIIEELSRRCGRRLCREALSQSGSESIGPVEIADIDCRKGKTFRFVARFSPMPEIELPDLGSFTIPDGSGNSRDLISGRLLEMIIFKIPDELIRAELGSEVGDEINEKSIEWKAASDRIKLMLILKKIAHQEGIEVDEADVERRIGEKAVEFGVNPYVLNAELKKGGGRQRLKDMLLAESTLDFLIEKSEKTSVVD